jgi:hypothetical protein
MTLLVTALAELHIIFGMTFLGSVFALNLVLGPGVYKLSPATFKEFFVKVWPMMARFLHASVGGTVLFGLLLYAGGGFGSLSASGSIEGILLDSGIVLGLLAVIEAEALQIPAANRLVRVTSQVEVGSGGGQQPSFSPEQSKIMSKIKVGGVIGLVTISLTVILMIAAVWA